MIHQSLIDSARLIRLEYEQIQNEVLSYEAEVKKLAEDFTKGSKEVMEISKNIKLKDMSLDGIKENLLNVLSSLEEKYNLLLNKVSEMNKRMETLKKQEWDLYELIKNKYPSLSDTEIKKQIQEKIKA
jgi:chromosome segregation ATPase